MVSKYAGSQPNTVAVTFTFPSMVWAESVHLVGDFNDWNRNSLPMAPSEVNWSITLELEHGKPYRFRYLVDSAKWGNDWNADAYVPNPLGGYDSVVTP